MYACNADDFYPAGDRILGHDIWGWNNWCEGKEVNFGHLIRTGIIADPSSDDHIFYCPSMHTENSPEGWFMFSNPPNPFDYEGNWGKGGAYNIVDIGYEYRDSYDDPPPHVASSDQYHRGDHAAKWSSKAMASDIFTRAYGRYCHKILYNVGYGDGSVLAYTDVNQVIESETWYNGVDDQEVFGPYFDPYYTKNSNRLAFPLLESPDSRSFFTSPPTKDEQPLHYQECLP